MIILTLLNVFTTLSNLKWCLHFEHIVQSHHYVCLCGVHYLLQTVTTQDPRTLEQIKLLIAIPKRSRMKTESNLSEGIFQTHKLK